MSVQASRGQKYFFPRGGNIFSPGAEIFFPRVQNILLYFLFVRSYFSIGKGPVRCGGCMGKWFAR